MTDTTSPTPAEHTALPWTFEIDEKRGEVFGYVIYDAAGEELFYEDADDNPACGARMRLIVAAVNSHAALLERVRKMERALEDSNKLLCTMAIYREMPEVVRVVNANHAALQPEQEGA